jgi:MFS family permease
MPSNDSILRQRLWKQRNFRVLWAGHTVSMFGSQITPVVFPILAALNLHATPAQMAVLLTLQYTPATVLGLFAGVWVDRMRRRPIMIVSDVARALLLLVIPIAATLGFLRLELLYMITLLLGIGGLFFGVADGAFLPALVPHDDLLDANSAITTSSTIARIAGPGIAGILIQWLTAPIAIVVDALSFIWSAFAVASLQTVEPAPPARETRPPFWMAMWEGVSTIIRHPLLRAFALSSLTFDLFWNMLYAVYVLYIVRVLGLPPATYGIILGVGSVGALMGASLVGRVIQMFGVGPTVICAQLLIGSASLLIPLAEIRGWLALACLIIGEFIQSCMGTIYGITRFSLTQAVTPNRLRGRVQASAQVIGLLPAVIGTLLGGLLGDRIGIGATILIGACGGMLGFLWVLLSPLRKLRSVPQAVEEMGSNQSI